MKFDDGLGLIKIQIFYDRYILQKSKSQQIHPEVETLISSISLEQKSSKFLPTKPVELTIAFGSFCPHCNLLVCGCSRNDVGFRRDSSANTCHNLQQEASCDLRGGRYIKSKRSLPTTECSIAVTRESHVQTSALSEKAAGGDGVDKNKKKKKDKKYKEIKEGNRKMGQGDVGSCCAKYLLCMFNFVFFVSRFFWVIILRILSQF